MMRLITVILVCMFLAMFVLKCAGILAASWLIVTAPLWGPIAMTVIIFGVGIVFLAIAAAAGYELQKTPAQLEKEARRAAIAEMARTHASRAVASTVR